MSAGAWLDYWRRRWLRVSCVMDIMIIACWQRARLATGMLNLLTQRF